MNRPLVLYHENCPDGFTAAWAAWRWFGGRAEYRGVQYSQPLPDDAWGRDLFIVDFSYPRPVLEQRALDSTYTLGATNLQVLDHHKTAQADLDGLPFCTFDMHKSGARLAWEHFHPGERVPALVQYVEDRDLWRWALTYSREVAAYVRSWRYDFAVWNVLAAEVQNQFQEVVGAGLAILRFQRQEVEQMARRARWVTLDGYRVPCVNATSSFSEVGERLCEEYPAAPFALYYFDRDDDKRQWGMRSRGGLDCSSVAKAHGGGGHPGAAGFTTSREWAPEETKR